MTDDIDYEYLKKHPSEFVRTVLDVEPFDYQQEVLESGANHRAVVSGRQVGKSRMASWIALHYAITHPGVLVLVTADAMRQSSELFKQLQSEMDNAGMTDDQWGIDRGTQTTIEFEHNSRIKVIPTGRNGNKIRGFTADMVIVDEAAFVDDSIFEDVIEPMTFATDGKIVLTSTPYGTSGYFYKKATEWHFKDHPNYYSTWDPDAGGISSYDNPRIDDEKIDEYKRGKTEDQIAREVQGRFVEGGDNFFPLTLIRESMSSSVERNSDKVYLGVDPSGGGDAESGLAMADEAGNVFRVEAHNGTTPELRRYIDSLHRNYNFEKILVDRGGVGEGFVEELREMIDGSGKRTVDQVYLTLQTKQDMYQRLKARMQANLDESDEMSTAPVRLTDNETLRSQMENLGYSTTANGNIRIQPKDKSLNDDHPDAVALAIWALPDNAATKRAGARGMTRAVTIGRMKDTGGKRVYQFESEEDEDENITRSFVGSTTHRSPR